MFVQTPQARLTVATFIAIAAVALGGGVTAHQGAAAGDTIFAVTSSNLLRFDSATPGTIDSTTPLTGLQAGEAIFAIDFRPATGKLYGIGSTGQIYTIDTSTATATPVGAPFALADPSETSMDFNPTVDRIRVVSSADENFRINPDTGALAGSDINLAYDAGDVNAGANPDVLAIGYTNNFAGASATTLFGIDNTLDILVRQGGVDGVPSPNTGTLFTIGSMGASSLFNVVGLDVGAGNTAFAYLEGAPGGIPQLFTIDLATGAATLVGDIGSSQGIHDIAAQVVPATPSPTATATPAAGVTATATATATPAQAPAALPPTGGEADGGDGSTPMIVLLVAVATVSVGLLGWHSRKRAR